MNELKRAQAVKAMDTMISMVNCEDYIDSWHMIGVADGDIKPDTTLEEIVEMGYTEDACFKDLLDFFVKIMNKAINNGGLYCDGIVSVERFVEFR